MNRRRRILILAAILVAAGAGVIIYRKFWSGQGPVAPAAGAVHAYRNPSLNLERIALKVFYAVPRDRATEIYSGWRELLPPVLGKMAAFHEVQFHGRSSLSYEIFPEPLVLSREAVFYDTENTNHGNPEGLQSITAEIEERAAEFLEPDSGEFAALAILYEGVGASGAPGAMILSRIFLSDPQYAEFASALFYHEFGHTLGLPDQYDLATNQPFSDDLMGGGRRRALDVNYLDRELLRDMNVF